MLSSFSLSTALPSRSSGRVIFDSAKDPQLLDDHSDRQEVRDALEDAKDTEPEPVEENIVEADDEK